MLNIVKNFLLTLVRYFESEEKDPMDNNSKSMLELVEEAKKEWHAAKDYFDSVTEPELIDYAVHSIKATEKRYNYLLKQLKHMELKEIK